MIKINKDDFIKLKIEDVTTTTFTSPAVDDTVQENIVPSGSRNLSSNDEIRKSNDTEKADITNAEDQPRVERENINIEGRFRKPNKLPSTVVANSKTTKERLRKSPLNETPLVVPSKVHKLNVPDNYNGSQMFMPTGERLFWLGEVRPSSFGTASYQDFNEIRSQCLADGKLFEDPEFPAIDRSLYYEKRPSKRLKWLRPKDISENPQLFVEGYSRFDVQQGVLGDCWLAAAVSNLTLHRNLFYQVVPNDQSFDEDYAGIFHFRFWQYGRWVDIVIDDRLPTHRGKLYFLHSSEKNEFWGALLEKAYAKLHGSYEALQGGLSCEAMVDFTGGVTEIYTTRSLPDNFFTILLKAYERNSLLGCSIQTDPKVLVLDAKTPAGLIRSHSYSVTRITYVNFQKHGRAEKIPLLRLRNPWGDEVEWNGAWSDKSSEWQFIPKSEREELGLTFSDDGEFWMSFKDFVSHFNSIQMCNLNPDSFNLEQCPKDCTKKWEMSVFEGKWIKDISAGGGPQHFDTFWKNPHYTITLKDPDEDDEENKCTIIVALMQKNWRPKFHHLDLLYIGFTIFRLPEDAPLQYNSINYKYCVGYSKSFTGGREVSQRFQLKPGPYVIVPSTMNQNEEGEFLLRVFSEKSNNMTENDEDVFISDLDDRVKKMSLNPEPADPIRDLFDRLAGEDGEVDWQELKKILDYAMKEEIAMRSHGINAWGEEPQEQNCLKQLLCTLCTTIYQKIGIAKLRELMQQEPLQQEQVLLDQPPLRELQGEGFSESACKRMIAMLDKDASGSLGFEEFKSLWIDLRQWRAVFRLYDTEGHGAVPQKHLRDALHSAGYTVNAHVLNVLAHRYSSKYGIRFVEFIVCLVRLKTKIGETTLRTL